MSLDQPRKPAGRSQVIDLLLTLADELGYRSDRDLANLAGVSTETIHNWRSGAVKELKGQKLEAIKRGLSVRIGELKKRARVFAPSREAGLWQVEIEDGSGPAELERQFRNRVAYHYLGHRFLYFDPNGALAWEMLLREGYDQERWLRGVEDCISEWFDRKREQRGRTKGILARSLGLDRSRSTRGIDVVSLGPGEGGKEVKLLDAFAELHRTERLPWVSLSLVDVSIPLLVKAARACSAALVVNGSPQAIRVESICADFEEGDMRFAQRLPTARDAEPEGIRLVLVLGNVFGNVRDEEVFLKRRLDALVRPGDLAWIEVGLRTERASDEPLFRLTDPTFEETSSDASRRLLLEGPYRRWEASMARRPSQLDMRVRVREDDDSARISGSINFCHDLFIEEERRTVSMLYSRRYQLPELTKWFEDHGYRAEATRTVMDSKRIPRVAHLLLRRR